MHIDAVVPCVGYDDFLAITLPQNVQFLDSVTVVTEQEDHLTAELARRLGAEVLYSTAWRDRGPLNKAAALNAWISRVTTFDPEQWLLVLDADILLLEPLLGQLPLLDARGLYSLRRRLCLTLEDLLAYQTGRVALSEFALDVPPLVNGKMWNRVPTVNPASLAGYLHLWCPMRAAGRLRYPMTGTAEAYDIGFALSFPEDLRAYLPGGEALHLGPTQVNWEGRRSPRWQAPLEGDVASSRAAV